VAETDLEVGLGAWPPLLSEAELKIRAQSPFSARRGRLGRAQTVRGSEHGRISAALPGHGVLAGPVRPAATPESTSRYASGRRKEK